MADVDICNQALDDIGARANIASLTDPTPQAVRCARWYNLLRQALLRTAPWGFARSQLVLTQLGDLVPDNTSPYPWLFQYAYPSSCLKMRYILCPPPPLATGVPIVGTQIVGPTWMAPSRANRYIVNAIVDSTGEETKGILSNIQGALGIFTADITNTNLFDPLFTLALSAALSYKLVMPTTGNFQMRKEFRDTAEDAIMKARAADGNEAIPKIDHQPDWITTRGVGSAFGWGVFGGPGGPGEWGLWYGGYDEMNWGM